MKIAVCYKLVPDDTQINFHQDGTADLSACEWQIGQYDLRAIEVAAQIAEKNDGVEVWRLLSAEISWTAPSFAKARSPAGLRKWWQLRTTGLRMPEITP